MKIQLNDVASVQAVTERSSKQISSDVVATPRTTTDRATLNADSASVQALVTQALKTPDTQQGKVDAIRQALDAGQYQIDPEKVADAIISQQSK
ncbi:flagellar biosynthesis anti-sigma factor FlgM [Granulicella sp. dw_53]|uniref:flagellar biosynthesis anti-sigma factor FlgM n=1 Tax=Granulicella sp. dw_53 TaxID=2719792 RepID=UPI001BD641EC|nr:flagellar biosynthesis anti-sigma factor FlgM [Granulicella sp. dw_53]